jgi:uracil-DNA glycosylase
VTEAERRTALDDVAAEVRVCTRCRLHEGRTQAVPGEGHPSTEVVFVGEGPGFNEDRQGRPFVGAAGSFLAELLGSVGWRRDEVFITNIVKCRPPGNRDPEPDEVAACAPYLRRQLEALDPALVVTLGRHSLARFVPGGRIGQAHGTTRPVDPETGARDASVFAMYHPAAALHQGSLRQTLLDDMAHVPAALVASRDRREANAATDSVAPTAASEPPEPVVVVGAPEAVATAAPATVAAPAAAGPALTAPEPVRPDAPGNGPLEPSLAALPTAPPADDQMSIF